jgi:hypothetical protein
MLTALHGFLLTIEHKFNWSSSGLPTLLTGSKVIALEGHFMLILVKCALFTMVWRILLLDVGLRLYTFLVLCRIYALVYLLQLFISYIVYLTAAFFSDRYSFHHLLIQCINIFHLTNKHHFSSIIAFL